MAPEKVEWKCKKFQIPTIDSDGKLIDVDQGLFVVKVPGEGGGWETTDFTCK